MSYQVLARKWRPKSFAEMVGQEHVVQALVNGLDQDRVHHAFLFTGTRGVGKTTLARIFAKCLNCERGMSSRPCGECASCVDIDEGRFVDIIEIDAASRTKVEDTRELLESVQYTPTRGRYKVYIIDEVHMLSNSSFNALLKTLEEPPPHVKFVLATTDPDKIPVTILSRCLQFNLRRMTPDQVLANLQHIVKSEGIEAETEALSRLARAADGSMRDGLSLLDQAIAYGAGKLTLADVAQMLGLVDHGYVAALLLALVREDARGILGIIGELVAQSRDPDSVLVSLAETLHRVNLLHCVPDYSDAERSDWESIREIAGQVTREDAQLFYQLALKGREELGLAPDPRTGLEMTLLRMLAFRPAGIESSQAPAGQGSNAGSGASQAGGRRGSQVAAAAARTQELAVTESNDIPWLAMAETLAVTGPVRELARNLHLKAVKNQVWEFVIDHALLHLASRDYLERLRRAMGDELGTDVELRVADSKEGVLHTLAAIEQSRMRTQLSEAERSIDEDPTVRALKKNFAARVIEDSVQPLQ